MKIDDKIIVSGQNYQIIRLLGHGKGGYSYLARDDQKEVVVKIIHHEPCDYYAFGNKIEAEERDYYRLLNAGITIPEMYLIDKEKEIIVKQYIEGDTIFEMIRNKVPVDPYLEQVRLMARKASEAGLNIDYFPTNFVVHKRILYYIDYECNEYMPQWNFENWGSRYWSYTEEFSNYLSGHNL